MDALQSVTTANPHDSPCASKSRCDVNRRQMTRRPNLYGQQPARLRRGRSIRPGRADVLNLIEHLLTTTLSQSPLREAAGKHTDSTHFQPLRSDRIVGRVTHCDRMRWVQDLGCLQALLKQRVSHSRKGSAADCSADDHCLGLFDARASTTFVARLRPIRMPRGCTGYKSTLCCNACCSRASPAPISVPAPPLSWIPHGPTCGRYVMLVSAPKFSLNPLQRPGVLRPSCLVFRQLGLFFEPGRTVWIPPAQWGGVPTVENPVIDGLQPRCTVTSG
jgi:hypothetical protein